MEALLRRHGAAEAALTLQRCWRGAYVRQRCMHGGGGQVGRLAADLSRVLHPRQRMGVRWVNRRLTAARASGVGYILADDPGLRQPYAISSMDVHCPWRLAVGRMSWAVVCVGADHPLSLLSPFAGRRLVWRMRPEAWRRASGAAVAAERLPRPRRALVTMRRRGRVAARGDAVRPAVVPSAAAARAPADCAPRSGAPRAHRTAQVGRRARAVRYVRTLHDVCLVVQPHARLIYL